MNKAIVRQLIVDGKHMVDARKLQGDDLTSDKLYIILMMDGYDEKPIYNGVDVGQVYYANEKLINYAIERYIREMFSERAHRQYVARFG